MRFRQQVAGHRRHQGARQQVRGQHREDHRQRQRRKEELRDSREQHDRNEDDADRERPDERRHGDLRRSVEDGAQERLRHRVVAVDVLDLDGRIVDEHADRERQAAQRHHVDGLAGDVQREDRRQDGERNRDDHDQHAPSRAEEDQHHQRHQHRRDHGLAHHVGKRAADETRLIERQGHVHALRRRRQDVGDRALDAVDHRQRRRRRVLDDHQVGRAGAVHPHHVRLHLVGVGDRRHVAERHRNAVDHPQRQAVEVLDALRTPVQLHAVLAVADLHRARGDDDVGRRQRVRHLLRRQVVRVERLGVEIHHDRPVDAAERRR